MAKRKQDNDDISEPVDLGQPVDADEEAPKQTVAELDNTMQHAYRQLQTQVHSGNVDPEFARLLHGQFLAIAQDKELSQLVSFNAQRAAETIASEALAGLKRESVTEFYRIVKYRE